jgi:dTDP-4-amino-4,6-dideoxygalactose transaminase
MVQKIPIAQSPTGAEEHAAVIKSGMLTHGPAIAEFERTFADNCG